MSLRTSNFKMTFGLNIIGGSLHVCIYAQDLNFKIVCYYARCDHERLFCLVNFDDHNLFLFFQPETISTYIQKRFSLLFMYLLDSAPPPAPQNKDVEWQMTLLTLLRKSLLCQF